MQTVRLASLVFLLVVTLLITLLMIYIATYDKEPCIAAHQTVIYDHRTGQYSKVTVCSK